MRDWIIQKAQTLETMSIRWNKGKVLILIHSEEESVKFSTVDLLNDLIAVRVMMLKRVNVVDIVGEHCLRSGFAKIVNALD